MQLYNFIWLTIETCCRNRDFVCSKKKIFKEEKNYLINQRDVFSFPRVPNLLKVLSNLIFKILVFKMAISVNNIHQLSWLLYFFREKVKLSIRSSLSFNFHDI